MLLLCISWFGAQSPQYAMVLFLYITLNCCYFDLMRKRTQTTYNILIIVKFSLQVVTVQDFDATSNNSWDNGNPGAGVSLVFVNMNVKVVVCDCGKTYQMSPELARKFYERGKKDPILPELTHQNDKILTCPKLTHYQQRYWISLISRKNLFSFRQIQIIKQELLLVVQKSCVFNKKLPNFTLFCF